MIRILDDLDNKRKQIRFLGIHEEPAELEMYQEHDKPFFINSQETVFSRNAINHLNGINSSNSVFNQRAVFRTGLKN